jgi:hypothetical protein
LHVHERSSLSTLNEVYQNGRDVASLSRFLTAVQELKALPQKSVAEKVQAIWDEFLAPEASAPVNIDSKSMNITRQNMEHPDRWTFDEAAVCIDSQPSRHITLKKPLIDAFSRKQLVIQR